MLLFTQKNRCLLSDKWGLRSIRCKQKYTTSPNWKKASWQKD